MKTQTKKQKAMRCIEFLKTATLIERDSSGNTLWEKPLAEVFDLEKEIQRLQN